MLNRGVFVVFEGVDGVGKTTVTHLLKKKFDLFFQNPAVTVVTQEPSSTTPVSNLIKKLLLQTNLHPLTEAFLFAANRVEHLHEQILPWQMQNKLILCDRFVVSSIVYQGVLRNLSVKKIRKINQLAINNFQPDYTFFLDANLENLLLRQKHVELAKDRLHHDFTKTDLLKKAANAYKTILHFDHQKTFKINANHPAESVTEVIFNHLVKLLKLNS